VLIVAAAAAVLMTGRSLLSSFTPPKTALFLVSAGMNCKEEPATNPAADGEDPIALGGLKIEQVAERRMNGTDGSTNRRGVCQHFQQSTAKKKKRHGRKKLKVVDTKE
jgi:hypothetical protein